MTYARVFADGKVTWGEGVKLGVVTLSAIGANVKNPIISSICMAISFADNAGYLDFYYKGIDVSQNLWQNYNIVFIPYNPTGMIISKPY